MWIENIIFDLDGTLVDSLPGIEYACRLAVRSVFPHREPPEVRPFIGPPIRDIFRQIFQTIEGEEIEKLVKEFRKAYDTVGWQKTVLFDGVAETLIRLRDLRIFTCLVTSKPELPALKILNFLKIEDYFEHVVCPDSATFSFQSKSDQILYLIDAYQLDVRKTLVIGDTKEDRNAAKENGIPFLAVSYGYGKLDKNSDNSSDFELNSIAELLKLVDLSANKIRAFKEVSMA